MNSFQFQKKICISQRYTIRFLQRYNEIPGRHPLCPDVAPPAQQIAAVASTCLHDYVAIAAGSAVIAVISRDISELNTSTGTISASSASIEHSADDLRRLAAKLNRLIDRFTF